MVIEVFKKTLNIVGGVIGKSTNDEVNLLALHVNTEKMPVFNITSFKQLLKQN